MVRSSDIIRKDEELKQRKTESHSDFLRLSDIVKLSGEAPPPAEQNVQPAKMDVDAVYEVYLKTHHYLRDIRGNVQNRKPFEMDPALDLINQIVNSPEMITTIHPMTLDYGKDEDFYLFQPIHVMIYALKTGMRMGYTAAQLSELGLSSLFQNIGMFLIPDDVISKKGNLTGDEIELIRKHPAMGADILQPFKQKHPWLIESVHQHHKRESGQGYPRGLKGDEIIEYAKIIGICDSYEAMTHNRPYKQTSIQFTAIKELIESREGLFSSQIQKVFLEELSLYPVGSYVKLNNGAIGRVIETNKLHPFKPVIKLLFDGNGERAGNGSVIHLSENNVLNITQVLSAKDLPAT